MIQLQQQQYQLIPQVINFLVLAKYFSTDIYLYPNFPATVIITTTTQTTTTTTVTITYSSLYPAPVNSSAAAAGTYRTNLLLNGDGETGPCATGGTYEAPTDWSPIGSITQVSYTDTNANQNSGTPGPSWIINEQDNVWHVQMSVINEGDEFIQLDNCFDVILLQLCKTLSRIPPIQMDEVNKMVLNRCRLHCMHDEAELDRINEFENSYRSDAAIRWHTKDSFLFRLLNSARCTNDMNTANHQNLLLLLIVCVQRIPTQKAEYDNIRYNKTCFVSDYG
ncbi:unnamed protein product [Didymodactylos carnosus]|uniref:Uncharacterized protein n=1 Tax=Didymodactylos carnosus TaxID=1234261 RepID=A0A814XIZ1_9BILA|nr:unnamed protein product [Didymodactylos carnosus]CAF3975800.1 unnamed protein product [Didymodactylos carnosus]